MFKKKSKFAKPTIVLLFLLISLSACSDQKVQNVKIETDANRIITVLKENGIEATKVEGGEGEKKTFEIHVSGDSEAVSAAIQLIEDHCLAKPEPPPVESGTFITSIEQEKAQEERRMKINIESQLRGLPGVTCVDVNFVPPEDRSMAIDPYASTASVRVDYKTPTFPRSEQDIAKMVARSVPALKPENVTVILSAKPLRPLPDNKLNHNFTRIALISGIGFATILLFVLGVFVLRKKRQNEFFEEAGQLEEYSEDGAPKAVLLEEINDFDEYEDEDLP